MARSEFIRKALFALSVPKCVACKGRLSYGDLALCPNCYAEFRENCTRNCSRCARVLSRCTCPGEYLEAHRIKKVVKVFRYLQREENRASNSLIYSLKRDNRRDVLELCADLLFDALSASFDNLLELVFTNVPRRRVSIVEFGIDHSEALSRELAKRAGAEFMSLFSSSAKRAQKSLHGEKRIKNAVFKIKNKADLNGKTLVIVDDVITTGASMCAVADLARTLGAKQIIAASLGIVYKDKFIPPQFTFF